ncbi:MAG: DDE-type integrase/transposase/recombinase, partial [Aquabacterium sp.]
RLPSGCSSSFPSTLTPEQEFTGSIQLGIEVDFSLPALRVIRALEQIIQWRGKPQVIRCDNGPEYISAVLQNWAIAKGIRLEYIQPGKPAQNAYVDRF